MVNGHWLAVSVSSQHIAGNSHWAFLRAAKFNVISVESDKLTEVCRRQVSMVKEI